MVLANYHRLRKLYDRGGMLDHIINTPWELDRALKRYSLVDLPRSLQIAGVERHISDIDRVVIVGMGGSAIGGDIVLSYLYERLETPAVMIKDFKVPRYVNDRTLLVGVSYSGETDETIAATLDGIERGAYPVLISSGGFMRRISAELGIPLYELPPGRPPRTAVAYMVAALLVLLDKVRAARVNMGEIDRALRFARNLASEYSALDPNSLPSEIASSIGNRTPLVYAYKPYTPIGYRFKTQINENSKTHAFFAELPEANHNEIMGWERGGECSYFPIFIRGSEEDDQARARIEYWLRLLREKNISFMEVWGKGPNRFAEMLYLLITCDMASYLLALLNRKDPTPVGIISGLKSHVESTVDPKRIYLDRVMKLAGSALR